MSAQPGRPIGGGAPAEERRAALLGAKLAALVKGSFGEPEPSLPRRPGPFPGGAALTDGARLWVLADAGAERALGAALALARQAGASSLHVLADEPGAGVLARRAACFADPPTVWAVRGTTIVPAEAAPFLSEPPLAPAAAAFIELLEAAGAEPVVEHGVLRGELLGLEVGRVVVGDGAPRLEVGVGRNDREAFGLIHGDIPTTEALALVIERVRKHRHPGAEPHPLNRMAPERWLRALLLREPRRVGADHLAPLAPTIARDDLRDRHPAPATGDDLDGRPLVVACSTGFDLDLVPAAADARLGDGRGARLVLAVPDRDDHPVTRALAAALVQPAEVVPLPYKEHRFTS